MYCKNCGSQIADNGTSCANCGNTVDSNSNYYSDTYRSDNFNKPPIDNPSHLAGIASCCFPLLGLILYFLWKDEKPNSASLVCKWMIGGIVAWVLFYILFFMIGIASALSSPY